MWLDRHRMALVCCSLIMAVALAACFRGGNIPGDPKTRLSEYIHDSFEVKSVADKKTLLGFLTGDAKTRLEAWSEEQFLDAFTSTKRQFLKLDFREVKPISEDRVNIVYEVTYLDQQKGSGKDTGHNAKVTTKKLCELTRLDGKWFINEVRNIKELVEYQDEITISPNPLAR